ncbi:hypothetical protein FA15DRAFT_559352, partial [Coprinopsis marcescibilis]
ASLQSPSYSTLVPVDHTSPVDTDGASFRTLVPPSRRSTFRPPRYSSVVESGQEDLDGSLEGQFPYCYPIKSGFRNKKWATLYIQNWRGHNNRQSKTTPFKVFGGDAISGVLELELESSQTITAIKLTIKGKIITGYLDADTFNIVEHPTTVWDRSRGDPKNPHATKAFDGVFGSGIYRFPFSIPFPTHTNISTRSPSWKDSDPSSPISPTEVARSSVKTGSISPFLSGNPGEADGTQAMAQARLEGGSQALEPVDPDVHMLPPSFLERNVPANTKYELTLCITHGMLRSDTRQAQTHVLALNIPIVYTPSFEPPPTPIARQSAYREGAMVPSPMVDPEGWSTLPSIMISGTLMEQRTVSVQCTLSLAKPPSYARGTVVPCYLALASHDVHALNALSTPRVQNVRLARTIRYCRSLAEAKAQVQQLTSMVHQVPGYSGGKVKGKGKARDTGRSTRWSYLLQEQSVMLNESEDDPYTITEEMEQAVWWFPPKGDVQQTPTERILEGEIHLAEDLCPSSPFPAFLVQYAIEIMAFQSSIFRPDEGNPISKGKGKQGLSSPVGPVYLRQPVVVATVSRSDEPVPTSFT